MKTRFATHAACAAVILLSACSDDGPARLATSEDVEFDGSSGLAGETMDLTAEEENGEVTGEVQFNELAASLECADTDTDGLVILGGEVTATTSDNNPPVGDWMAVIIWEGDPDRVVLWSGETADSCREVLEEIPDNIADNANVTNLADGYDIETG